MTLQTDTANVPSPVPRKCASERCPNPALLGIHWPGKPLAGLCIHCTARARKVAHTCGFELVVTILPEGAAVNEALEMFIAAALLTFKACPHERVHVLPDDHAWSSGAPSRAVSWCTDCGALFVVDEWVSPTWKSRLDAVKMR